MPAKTFSKNPYLYDWCSYTYHNVARINKECGINIKFNYHKHGDPHIGDWQCTIDAEPLPKIICKKQTKKEAHKAAILKFQSTYPSKNLREFIDLIEDYKSGKLPTKSTSNDNAKIITIPAEVNEWYSDICVPSSPSKKPKISTPITLTDSSSQESLQLIEDPKITNLTPDHNPLTDPGFQVQAPPQTKTQKFANKSLQNIKQAKNYESQNFG